MVEHRQAPIRNLIPAEDIARALTDMGRRITSDYTGQELLMVGVLKGAFIVMADLARHIDLPVHFDFMAVSSYGAATQTSGVVRILKDLDTEIADRHVLIVEDIIDSGLTLSYLLKSLAVRRPASLEVAALLLKEGIQGFHSTSSTLAFGSDRSLSSVTGSTTPGCIATLPTSA